jgi:predicted O-methyltransferase YrrM
MNVLQRLKAALSGPTVNSINEDSTKKSVIEQELSNRIRHYLPSFLLSLDDEPHQPSNRLIEIAQEAIKLAWEDDLKAIQDRMEEPERTYIKTFPGEHYRLLNAIVKVIRPKTIIEIGTYRGLGCLTLKASLPEGSKVITYDIFPWEEIPGTHLKKEDWDSRMEFRQKDLCNPKDAAEERDTLLRAY